MLPVAPPSPRFESDKEDGEESKSRKLVFDGIDAASKCAWAATCRTSSKALESLEVTALTSTSGC